MNEFKRFRQEMVDIETEWNLKYKGTDCDSGGSHGRYRNRVEFKG